MFKEGIPASLIIAIVLVALISAIATTYWQYTKTYESNNTEESIVKAPEPEEETPENGKSIIKESQTGTESMSGNKNLVRKDFLYPYPIEWTYQHTKTFSFKYSLTGVSLGRRKVPSFVGKNIGKEINALTLYLKIASIGKYGAQVCLDVDLRMIANEQGDFIAPINRMFNAHCFGDNQTYYNQEVIFEVPSDKKEFIITTGGDSNIFFTVKVLDNGDIEVVKEVPIG